MNQVARLAQPQQKVDTRPVLATAPLRPGFSRQDISQVDDLSWDLAPAVFRDNARRCHVTVHFGGIENPAMAQALRELLYARLNIELPGYRARLHPTSVRQAFNRARRFFTFVREALGGFDLGRVDQALLDRYAKTLGDGRRTPVVVAQLLEVIFDLHAYRDHLPSGSLRFEPWPGRSAPTVAGWRARARENLTPRIPEPVIAALLAWSIRYIRDFAPDILAARRELTALEDHRARLMADDARLTPRVRRRLRLERLAVLIEERRVQGRGMPVWTSAPNGEALRRQSASEDLAAINYTLIHLRIGIDARKTAGDHIALRTPASAMIAAALAELGTEVGGMETQPSLAPNTGRPWRPRFDVRTLLHEERMLQAACYVVCAYLTGMRDCEVQAMRPGCLTLTRSEDGIIERHRIRSTAYKGRQAAGEPNAWVTIAPVADAVTVLETLAATASTAHGADTLWPVLNHRRARKTHLSSEVVGQLNIFRAHLDALFGAPGAPAIPPGPNGRPWRLTTRQFRRTIAWHIANRPFGTVAGMIQYKHASVAAFEGYAGSSRCGFRAEVEAERRLGQLDDILRYFDRRQLGETLSGPAASRIGRALDTAAQEVSPLPGMIADRARLRAALASTARTLHPGVLADCFFDPSTALCLRGPDVASNPGPAISMCQPTRCPNACITPAHRPTWAQAAEDARAHLTQKRLPGLQRSILTQELERFTAILDDLGPAT